MNDPQVEPIVPAWTPCTVGVAAASATLVVLLTEGRGGALTTVAAAGAFLALTTAGALLSFLLATGLFPPRLGRDTIDLPTTTRALEEAADVGERLVDRVAELEAAVADLQRRLPP